MDSIKQKNLINKINAAGISNNPKYRFQSFVKNSNPLRAIIVLLDGTDPKARLVTEITRKDSKNFYHHYSTEQDTIKTINQVGIKSDPSFEFVRILPGLNKDRKRVIEVRNIKTGELA